jgi:hypothetical protein
MRGGYFGLRRDNLRFTEPSVRGNIHLVERIVLRRILVVLSCAFASPPRIRSR